MNLAMKISAILVVFWAVVMALILAYHRWAWRRPRRPYGS